jgi:uncharacterized protein (DUF342 family)
MEQQTGGANLNAHGDINVGSDIIGRDMITNINYEAATLRIDSYILAQ